MVMLMVHGSKFTVFGFTVEQIETKIRNPITVNR